MHYVMARTLPQSPEQPLQSKRSVATSAILSANITTILIAEYLVAVALVSVVDLYSFIELSYRAVLIIGRTHKHVDDAVTDAERAIKKTKATVSELRQALKGLLGEHRLLQRWYQKVVSERDQAYVLLRDKYQVGQEPDEDTRRRAVVTELIGEGYDMTGSQRTFQRHKAMALGSIKRIAGDSYNQMCSCDCCIIIVLLVL